MANIELVIKISEETYTHLLERYMYQNTNDIGLDDNVKVGVAIKNGIPLPRGRGRIGDLDALRKEVSSWGMNDYEPSDFTDAIDQADTILEADKEVENEGG